jgi:hypothetical protein
MSYSTLRVEAVNNKQTPKKVFDFQDKYYLQKLYPVFPDLILRCDHDGNLPDSTVLIPAEQVPFTL